MAGHNTGTVYGNYARCGKKKCRCKENDKYRHGPYYYLSFKDKGKTKMKLLHRDVKENAEDCVKQYKKLWKSLCQISEINLQLLMPAKVQSKENRSS